MNTIEKPMKPYVFYRNGYWHAYCYPFLIKDKSIRRVLDSWFNKLRFAELLI